MSIQTNDAQANLGFVISQTSHIEKQVNELPHAEIQYKNLIPIDNSANPWAKSVTYFSSDKFGQAGWINGNSDDIPLAGTEKAKHESDVFMAGVGYGFGLEEINHARMHGENLQADDAKAARRAYEVFVEKVAFTGSEEKGFKGFLNHPDVTVRSATNGDWSNVDEGKILQDINDAILLQAESTNFVSYADTLLLPVREMSLLATRRLGDTTETILSFIRKNNTYTAMTGKPLIIRSVRNLKKSGQGGINRMIAYRRNPEVLKLHIPMPHRFLPLYQKNSMYYEKPGIFRVGGLDIRLPREVSYTDGI